MDSKITSAATEEQKNCPLRQKSGSKELEVI